MSDILEFLNNLPASSQPLALCESMARAWNSNKQTALKAHELGDLADKVFNAMTSSPVGTTSSHPGMEEAAKFNVAQTSVQDVHDILKNLGFSEVLPPQSASGLLSAFKARRHATFTLNCLADVARLLALATQSSSPKANELKEYATAANYTTPQSRLDALSEIFGFLGNLSAQDQPLSRSQRLEQKLGAKGITNDETSITDIANAFFESCAAIPQANGKTPIIELRIPPHAYNGISNVLEAAEIWQAPQKPEATRTKSAQCRPMIETALNTSGTPRTILLEGQESARDLMALAACATSNKAKENAQFLLQYSKKYASAINTPKRPGIATPINTTHYRR